MQAYKQIETSKKGSINVKNQVFRIQRKNLKKMLTASALSGVIVASVVVPGLGNINNMFKKGLDQYAVNKSIATMLHPENSKTVTGNYTYIVDRSTGAYSYQYDDIAKDMLNCKAENFDLVMYRVYKDMINRNSAVNELFDSLKFYLDRIRDTNPELYYKLKGVNSFDDYLRKLGLVDKEGKVSYEKYEELGDTLTKLQRESLTQNDETELVSNNRGLK